MRLPRRTSEGPDAGPGRWPRVVRRAAHGVFGRSGWCEGMARARVDGQPPGGCRRSAAAKPAALCGGRLRPEGPLADFRRFRSDLLGDRQATLQGGGREARAGRGWLPAGSAPRRRRVAAPAVKAGSGYLLSISGAGRRGNPQPRARRQGRGFGLGAAGRAPRRRGSRPFVLELRSGGRGTNVRGGGRRRTGAWRPLGLVEGGAAFSAAAALVTTDAGCIFLAPGAGIGGTGRREGGIDPSDQASAKAEPSLSRRDLPR